MATPTHHHPQPSGLAATAETLPPFTAVAGGHPHSHRDGRTVVITAADTLTATPTDVAVLDDRRRTRTDSTAARASSPLASRQVAAGHTQEHLAEESGVYSTTVRRWERGVNVPQPWQRPNLAHLLRITLEQLDDLLRATQRPGACVASSGAAPCRNG